MLNREKIELYENELSFLFEAIAGSLIDCPLTFDGATGLTAKIRKSRQVVFQGKMWILDIEKGNKWKDSLEPFEAIFTDKRITKQGVWIKIRVGEYVGEGELSEKLEVNNHK